MKNSYRELITSANGPTDLHYLERPARYDQLGPLTRNEITAISPTGNHVGLFVHNKFRIFKTHDSTRYGWERCYGAFMQGQKYDHGRIDIDTTGSQDHLFATVDFRCAAISDEFVALAITDHILIFDVADKGKALLTIPFDGFPSRLLFSPQGDLLLALAGQSVRTISTTIFRGHCSCPEGAMIPNSTQEFSCIARWQGQQQLNNVAFSKDGRQIVMSTNCPSNGCCEIRILRLTDDQNWRPGQCQIPIRPSGSGGGKVAGIQLYAHSHLLTD